MKKFLFTLAVLLQLASSSGMVVHLHYCMGRMVNWDLTDKKNDRCDRCGMLASETPAGCCHDESRFHKYTGDQQFQSGFNGPDRPSFLNSDLLCELSTSGLQPSTPAETEQTSPHLLIRPPGPPLFLSFRVFRI